MDINMITRFRNQNNRFHLQTILNTVLLFLLLSVFFSCKYDPETMIPMTPEAICKYMNEHFEGEFELIDFTTEDSDEEKSNCATMKCSLFGDKTVQTKHGYSDSIFGWHKIFLTNYNEIYYRENVEKTYGKLIKDWFGSFEYKYVHSRDNSWSDVVVYKSFEDYLKSSPMISYKVVINACDEDVKQYAIKKAKSVYFDIRNKREYPISIELYLWDDEDFALLSEETILDFGRSNDSTDSNQYRYFDVNLENYSQ